MRRALVVGINYYQHVSPLFGCVDDAYKVKSVLERHADGTINFDVRLLSGTGPTDPTPKSELKEAIRDLFATDAETALFYFAGHGSVEPTGGYIFCSDSQPDDGFPLSELLTLANKSPARNRIVVLDSCHSGLAGNHPVSTSIAELTEGTTILTASTAEQYASEKDGAGVFTSLLVDALSGSASNLVGDITPGSVYAHIDQSLGAWDQRPVFKTNVKSFVSLRKVQPPISLADLRRITEFFPTPGAEFQLDPSFEPELQGRKPHDPGPIPEHTRAFAILQRYNRVNLVVPVDAPHMWHAAMESKSCRLTVLGEHYRKLVERKRI